jgi:hypothetical protein
LQTGPKSLVQLALPGVAGVEEERHPPALPEHGWQRKSGL